MISTMLDSVNRQPPAWLTLLDHTADIGVAVRAPTLPLLFERAAWGLFGVITDMHAVRPLETVPVSVKADDREGLLVHWLSELNFLHETGAWLFCSFHVQRFSDTGLAAEVRGERLDRARHEVHAQVKAVTYHALLLEHEAGEWIARVLFDV
jgi:SHS2 domain-containing protein